MKKLRHLLNAASILGLLSVLSLSAGGSAWAGSVSACTAETCNWDITINGTSVITGHTTSILDWGYHVRRDS